MERGGAEVAYGPARAMIGYPASPCACAVLLPPAQPAAGPGSAAFGGFEGPLPESRRVAGID